MPLRPTKFSLHTLVAIPVAAIVLGALAMSIAAVIENVHFINATNQILGVVGSVRTIAAGQASFAQTPGEDVWADLERLGQIAATSTHPNPWHGDVQIKTVSNAAMRIESVLPTHDCRRMAIYFLEHQPTDLGLISMDAQSVNNRDWMAIYPAVTLPVRVADLACGRMPYARLALTFTIR
jgi:hypothetical protein